MVTVAGWDIGGANCKACRLEWNGKGSTRWQNVSRPLAMWREPERLSDVIAGMVAELGPVSHHALTMTAELCDVFASKNEGVEFVLDAATRALGGLPLWVWTSEARLRPAVQIRDCPLQAAAANWLATGVCVGEQLPRALLIDMGTTTTDLIPIDQGKVTAVGRTDPQRLEHGELVYTGMVRTPICALTSNLYVDGRPVHLAAEWFAVTGDAYVLLGLLNPDDYALPTPDGRPPTPEACARRMARMLCADAGELGAAAVHVLARQVADAQLSMIARGAMQVLSRQPDPWSVPVVGAGLGRNLVRQVAARLGLSYIDLAELGLEGGQAAPAGAVAYLMAKEVAAWPPFHC